MFVMKTCRVNNFFLKGSTLGAKKRAKSHFSHDKMPSLLFFKTKIPITRYYQLAKPIVFHNYFAKVCRETFKCGPAWSNM